MSREKYIDKLLQNLKIEWTTLGNANYIELADKKRKAVKSSNRIEGNIPYYGANNIQDYVDDYTHDGTYVLVAEDGTTSVERYSIQWATGKFWANNHVHVLRAIDGLDNRFLFHYLHIVNFVPFLTGGGRAKLTKAKLLEIPIPIPYPDDIEKSLAIQRRIVDILDKFTELEAELEAELEGRKRQYEYYRNKLLSFDILNKEEQLVKNVSLIPLGSIGDICMCKRILKHQTSDKGDIPFYKIGTFGKVPNSFISKELFYKYKEKYNYPLMGDVLISASGTIGRAVIFDGKDAYFQDSNIVWIKNDESKVLNKYLYYYYQIAKWNVAEGGTIQRLYNDNLRKTLIPIPYSDDKQKSLSEQQRIVSILDKFDMLTTSISEGLPKEIELRRKQYEYYRDRLLSFKH